MIIADPLRLLREQKLVPRGRDEDALPFTMAWVRHRDRYADVIGHHVPIVRVGNRFLRDGQGCAVCVSLCRMSSVHLHLIVLRR
jgi:hypothetical protein